MGLPKNMSNHLFNYLQNPGKHQPGQTQTIPPFKYPSLPITAFGSYGTLHQRIQSAVANMNEGYGDNSRRSTQRLTGHPRLATKSLNGADRLHDLLQAKRKLIW
jgi:hypothetical protein